MTTAAVLTLSSGIEEHPMSPETAKLTPLARLVAMVVADKRDLSVLVVYTAFIGLFSLAVPLAAQSLVNTIAAGVFIQPLVVLSLLLLVGLTFNSVLRLMEFCLVENLERRIFARITLTLGEHVSAVKSSALNKEYLPELFNRFFDVRTLQKAWGKLLLEGPTATLQVVVGLLLMAFYSPYLLAFALLVGLFVAFAAFVLGIGGLTTRINESATKYHVAEWLEDMGRCQTALKTSGSSDYLAERADNLVLAYLEARRAHFAVLLRQAFATYFFQALAFSGVLAIGGWLVINRQLTLGQLVAAELIVLMVLAAVEKLIRLCDTFYELLTALHKVGHITDLPAERKGGVKLPEDTGGLTVALRNVHFAYEEGSPVLSGLSLYLSSGQRVSLVGASGAGKSTVAALLYGMQEASHGTVEICALDIRDVDLKSLRRAVGLVGDENEIFEGTIEENITLGRDCVSHADVRWALEVAQFTEDLVHLSDGVKTHLVSGGRNLCRGGIQRLLIARAIVDRPRLLILDEAFTGIDEKTKLKIVAELLSPEYDWTVLNISHDAEIVMRSDVVHVVRRGTIVESGLAVDLACHEKSEFASLFPDLAAQICLTGLQRQKRAARK